MSVSERSKSVYFTAEQIEQSILKLGELNPFFGTVFLAFKEVNVPEDKTMNITFLPILEAFLQKYYRPTTEHTEFYTPFKTSNKKQRWNTKQYANTLHRVAVDTFSDVIIHPKSSREWGWKKDYIHILAKEHLFEPIPTFDLAVWLFRTRDWPQQTSKAEVINTFFSEFQIRDEEKTLFVRSLTDNRLLLQENPISTNELLEIIGYPPNATPNQRQPMNIDNSLSTEYGARLQNLKLSEIGPANEFDLDFASRLNVITGDNALGKTFLLECAWWALTSTWASRYPAYPDPTANAPSITFQIGKEGQSSKAQTASYNWKSQAWSTPNKRNMLPGLSIFSQADGSFTVWDPAKIDNRTQQTQNTEAFLYMNRDDVWGGSRETRGNKTIVRCRGLIEDWTTWQASEPILFTNFCEALKALSPHPQYPLVPGEPTRVPGIELDVRAVPTLQFPYGAVPIIFCSAGIKRIVALAYILVWAWHEHTVQSELIRQDPQHSIVLIIDEMEAHLHPFWQRAIVPAIIAVIQALAQDASTQIIIATHSPLVLASMEPIFDEELDKLFHLYMEIEDGSVQLNEEPFVKRGRIDRWLTSDIFGLTEPRSMDAEEAIQEANNIQLEENPEKDLVQDISDKLKKFLAPDDEFWPRWTYFAKERGVHL